jgi:hypothetical protein
MESGVVVQDLLANVAGLGGDGAALYAAVLEASR